MALNSLSFIQLELLLCIPLSLSVGGLDIPGFGFNLGDLFRGGSGGDTSGDWNSHSGQGTSGGGRKQGGVVYPESTEEPSWTIGGCSTTSGDSPKYVERKDWNARESRKTFPDYPGEPEYVVISQSGTRCVDRNDCILQMQEEQRKSLEEHGDLLSNFYIGDEGSAYEGLGWGKYDYSLLGGLGKKSLRISFFGIFQSTLPSAPAIDAFKRLLMDGLCSGHLSLDYKLVSIRRYYDSKFYLGDELNGHIRYWNRFKDDFDMLMGREFTTAGLFPLVFREEWNARKSKRNLPPSSTPIDYVVIRDWGKRCFTSESCIRAMKAEQEDRFNKFGDVPFNFYVGDDGLAYEGRGWDVVPYDNFRNIRKKSVVVAFFGQYKSYTPSPRALMALKKLLKDGVIVGKLSPNYKILSFRSLYPTSTYPGDALNEEIKKMERYSSKP